MYWYGNHVIQCMYEQPEAGNPGNSLYFNRGSCCKCSHTGINYVKLDV